MVQAPLCKRCGKAHWSTQGCAGGAVVAPRYAAEAASPRVVAAKPALPADVRLKELTAVVDEIGAELDALTARVGALEGRPRPAAAEKPSRAEYMRAYRAAKKDAG